MKITYDHEDLVVTLSEIADFDVEQIFTCGQCFRWLPLTETCYRGVVFGTVVDVEQVDSSTINIRRITKEFFETYLYDYFDFDCNYSRIKEILIQNDKVMQEAVSEGRGIRILNQAPFETLLSFIISGNNNIPRIMKAIDALSRNYGTFIESINGTEYYSFPTPEQLIDVTIEDFRSMGVGYRDKYLYHAVQGIVSGDIPLEAMGTYEDFALRKALLAIKGVGPKIADCIILFAFKRKYAFPVDTWVKKIMKAYYVKEDTKDKDILTYADQRFGQYAGIAQQYLFYYSRKNKL